MALSYILNRNLKPNWRSPYNTFLNGELDSPKVNSTIAPLVSINSYINDWRYNKSIPYAGELIGAAISNGNVSNKDVHDAAEWIITRSKLQDNHPLFELAKGIVIGSPSEKYENQSGPSSFSEKYNKDINLKIHNLRMSVNLAPRNAYRHIELARTFLLVGERDKAKTHTTIATQIAPNDRYVTRSAVRCFLHNGDYDQAKYVLSQNKRLKIDPWLLATDISVELIRDKTPKNAKLAKDYLDRKVFSPRSFTEMAIALAVLENKTGSKNKKIRHLIELALCDPIDNSVAQAQWLNHLNPVLRLDFRDFSNLKFNYEVETYRELSQDNYDAAYKNALGWLSDSGFSHRAAITTSNIASTYLNNVKESIEILRFGLRANPGAPNLLNNLAYQLLMDNQINLAEKELKRVNYRNNIPPETLICLRATNGLLNFRKRQYDKGTKLYMEAIEIAKKNKDCRHANLALLNLTYEQYNAKIITQNEAINKISSLRLPNEKWINVQIDTFLKHILFDKCEISKNDTTYNI